MNEYFEDIENKFECDSVADKFWDSLSYEQKMMAFYSVCTRIHRGDIVDKGSYRYVLYQIFGFGPESYELGLNCGYLDIHNSFDTQTIDDIGEQKNEQ